MRNLENRGMLARLDGAYRRSFLANHSIKDTLVKSVVQAFIRAAKSISSFDSSPILALPQRLAILFGVADRDIIGTISPFITEGCVFWDVGANIGHITRALAKTSRTAATLYALEPNPEVFDVLARNLETTKSGRAMQLALGASDGKMSLFVGDYCLFASASRQWVASNNMRPAGIREHVVSVRSGDSLIRTGEAKAPEIMKIDVEGHEIAVLDGLRDHVAKARNLAVVCEFNPPAMKKAGYEPIELFRKLLDAHFRLWHIDASRSARALRTIDDARRFQEHVGDGYVNIFAVKGYDGLVKGW